MNLNAGPVHLRRYIFSDPEIRGAYKATLLQTVQELIDYEPGDASDSLNSRLKRMGEVIGQSDMPAAIKAYRRLRRSSERTRSRRHRGSRRA